MFSQCTNEAKVTSVRAAAYRIPTDMPEADGSFAWTSTTLILCEVEAADETGLGYTYSDKVNAGVITGLLANAIEGRDAMNVAGCTEAMRALVRNNGREGIAATAISAVDLALWDLKAKLLGVSLVTLLGGLREAVPIYGSGGFTTYSDFVLRDQLGDFIHKDGCRWVKIKIGTDAAHDAHRMKVAKEAIGDAALFIDANGAFAPREALSMAAHAAAYGVTWFEEPVSSDDLDGLSVRHRAPAGMDIAAGEYGYDLDYFRRMLAVGATDVQQVDASRCGGLTGFLAAATLCEAYHVPLSGHCAPAIHLHVACAAPRLRHLEWFHDHVRIESMLFDGAPIPHEGLIRPDLTRPGHGLAFKRKDAESYAV